MLDYLTKLDLNLFAIEFEESVVVILQEELKAIKEMKLII